MKLRQYQLDIAERGLKILQEYGLLYLALEPRVGKTITSGQVAHLYGAKSVLFVTKKKTIEDITGQYASMPFTFKLTVINYESLHLVTGEFDFYILDESHQMAAFPKPSKRTKLLKQMIGSKPVVFLSATPTAEGHSMWYHQLWVSARSPFAQWKTFYTWALEFVDIRKVKYAHGIVNDYSRGIKEKIDPYVLPILITFTQEQAGFTQLVEEEVMMVKMCDKTYSLADRLLKDKIVQRKLSGQLVVADTAAKMLQKLHQIYSGTVITEEHGAAIFDTTKADFIKETFKGKRIAIFYKFIAEGEMLRSMFNWTDNANQFNQTRTEAGLVFLTQIQSGREGLNLHTADMIVMFNIDHSSISYFQARARLQTKDRTNAAKVVWIFSAGGIEQKIYKAVTKKLDYTTHVFKKDYMPKFSGATK